MRLVVRVEGLLTVTATASGATAAVPNVLWRTGGDFDDAIRRMEPGGLTVAVFPGLYLVHATLPDTLPAQRVELSTTLR